ncbi:hypothetical protein Acr_18g0000570 [Actinidia rufa]|uniref:Transmembrane protein n=1 Tax=Actinidia rufa TaxID=165716 RepID=A0A7J0G542_9ERIC|nr:hypothetical protein Acr_18g0000570 [Actinidia rufa]
MATPAPPYLPDQQQAQESVPNPDSSWHSSGSIGPFFAVIPVLAVLAILSCVLGRIVPAWAATPSEKFYQAERFFGWLKGRWRRCTGGDCGVGQNSSTDCKAQDGV